MTTNNNPLNNKQKVPKVWAFSFFDWAFIGVVLILTAFLVVFPFLNHNNQAIVFLIQKKYEKAENKWRLALEQKPFSSLYRLNLALNYQLGEQSSKALKEYQVIQNFTKIKNQHVFYSLFNSALVETQKNRVQQALNFYQNSLAFKPHSLEVKTNIELLLKKGQSDKKSGESKKKNQRDLDKKGSSGGSSQEQKNQGEQKTKQSPEEQGPEQEKQEQEGQNQEQSQGQEQEQSQDQEQSQEGQDQEQERKNQQEQEGKNQEGQNQGQEGQPQDLAELKNPSTSNKNKTQEGQQQNLNSAQTEAILQAISDQEQQIKKRRQRRRKTPSPNEKDW